MSFLCLTFAVQHLADIIYSSINKRYINPYSFLSLWDLVIFVFYFTNIMTTYARNLNGTWEERPVIDFGSLALIYARNFMDYKTSEDAIWIICIVCLWIRVFYLLRFNEYMGKFIGIVDRLFYDLFIFFCFYLL